MTVREAIDDGARALKAGGVSTPEWDAELLLRHTLGWSRADVISRDREKLSATATDAFRNLIALRSARHPLQHLTGSQEFWRHEVNVTPDVLIPRPETEILVETVLDLIRGISSPLVLDVGTGSGCIALAIAAERRDARIVATDLSVEALTIAAANLTRHSLRPRVALVAADLLEPFPPLAGRVQVIASNPPYVSPDADLAPEVRDHEPRLALFPPGALDSVYRRLIAQASPLLAPKGFVALELGVGLEAPVREICHEHHLTVTEVRHDLQGIPRTLVAHRL